MIYRVLTSYMVWGEYDNLEDAVFRLQRVQEGGFSPRLERGRYEEGVFILVEWE